MERDLYEKILKSVPNIPEEAIRLWLLPFAKELGWPPSKTWGYKIGEEPVEFWNDADWERRSLNIPSLDFSIGYRDTMIGLREAYLEKKTNIFSEVLGDIGRKKYNRALKFIMEHQKFPEPPILYTNELGKYEIMDGNHRFFALLVARQVYEEHRTQKHSKEEEISLMEKIGIEKILPPEDIQQVWVCHPRWENSKAAARRNYLRSQGINFI